MTRFVDAWPARCMGPSAISFIYQVAAHVQHLGVNSLALEGKRRKMLKAGPLRQVVYTHAFTAVPILVLCTALGFSTKTVCYRRAFTAGATSSRATETCSPVPRFLSANCPELTSVSPTIRA